MSTVATRSCAWSILFAVCATLFVSSASAQNPTPLAPNSLQVSRVQYDGNNFGNTGTYPTIFSDPSVTGIQGSIFIDQFSSLPGSTVVGTLSLPSSGSSFITSSFSSKSEGALMLSPNGTYLTYMGYAGADESGGVSNSYANYCPADLNPTGPGPFYNREVALIGANGLISLTQEENAFSGDNPRAAITVDGNELYMAGNSDSSEFTASSKSPVCGLTSGTFGPGLTIGARYDGPLNSKTPPDLSIQLGVYTAADRTDESTKQHVKDNNWRGIGIFNGNLYVSKGSGGNGDDGVFQVGSGLPTGTGNTITELFGAPATNPTTKAASPYTPFGFFFANPTTLYVADEGYANTDSNGNLIPDPLAGLQKWSLVGNTWQLQYTIQAGLNLYQATAIPGYPVPTYTYGIRNLTGSVNGDGTVTLYAITSQYSTISGGEPDPTSLVGITDSLAATALPANEQFVTLQTAALQEVYRGVAFIPPTPGFTRAQQTINFAPIGTQTYGQGPITLSATASSGWPVYFTVASGPATVSGNTLTITGAGQVTVNATQSGNTDYAPLTVSQTFTVSQVATSIAVTNVNPPNEDYGLNAPVTITAVLSWTGTAATPTGTITIGGNGNGSYGATSCGAPSGDTITCTATYTPTNADAAGLYTETATYAGDSNYSGSSSSQTNNFTIGNATTSTSVSSSGSPSTYGQAVTFTATITAENNAVKPRARKNGRVKSNDITGSVTWSDNTGCGTTSVTWSATNQDATATCTTSTLAPGSDTVTATYSGDSSHGGSSGSVSQTVSQASTSISVTSVSPSSEDYGLDAPVTITAVLTWTGNGAAPTGANVTIGGNGPSGYSATSCGAASGNSITCTATYTPTTTDAAGSYTESATFSGDANYTSSSSSQTNNFSINTATSTVSINSGLNPSTYGQTVTFTATINGENGAVKGRSVRKGVVPTITGTVTWSANTGCGTTTVTSGNPGTATCTTSSLGAGSDSVTATYSGDSNHSGSSGSFSQTVNPASQTITLKNVPGTAAYGTSFTVTGTASSGLTVTFTSSGVCTNSIATYTMTSGTGSCSVIANQPGDQNHLPAPQVTKTATAIKATPTVSFTGLPSNPQYGNTYPLTATTNASTTATITSTTLTVCTVSGTSATIVKDSGTCSLTAAWAADSNYTSFQTSQVGTAVKGVPVITWPTPQPIVYGTPLGGTQLDATATPGGGTFTYSPAAGAIETVGNKTLKVTYNSGNTNYTTATASVTLVVTAAPTTTTITSPDQTVKLNINGTATATVNFNVTSYKPTGAVSLTASTGEVCSGTLSSSTGNGMCKLTFTTTGTRTITAAYPGDANHTGSNNSNQTPAITVTVNP